MLRCWEKRTDHYGITFMRVNSVHFLCSGMYLLLTIIIIDIILWPIVYVDCGYLQTYNNFGFGYVLSNFQVLLYNNIFLCTGTRILI